MDPHFARNPKQRASAERMLWTNLGAGSRDAIEALLRR